MGAISLWHGEGVAISGRNGISWAMPSYGYDVNRTRMSHMNTSSSSRGVGAAAVIWIIASVACSAFQGMRGRQPMSPIREKSPPSNSMAYRKDARRRLQTSSPCELRRLSYRLLQVSGRGTVAAGVDISRRWMPASGPAGGSPEGTSTAEQVSTERQPMARKRRKRRRKRWGTMAGEEGLKLSPGRSRGLLDPAVLDSPAG